MKKPSLFLMLFAALFLISCGNVKGDKPDIDPSGTDSDTPEENDPDEIFNDGEPAPDEGPQTGDEDQDLPLPDGDNDSPARALGFESGFIALEEISYKLENIDRRTGTANMWYNFQPADENPETKPLFVFYNGGPGGATSILFTYNTAKMTADQAYAGTGVAENESNWNQIGNLLYIDARQTGFSFSEIENVESTSAREAYFSKDNFNVFADAADFIRVILRFLDSHPQIMANPVIMTGESYGGTRTTAIINLLLNVADYAGGNRIFYDGPLFEEIAAHFRKIDSSVSGMPELEVVKQQFGHQIMIEPLVAGETQFETAGDLLEETGSPMYEVESETGIDFTPCREQHYGSCDPFNNALYYLARANRDVYAYRREGDWLTEYTNVGARKMLDIDLWEALLLNDPRKIGKLYASERTNAFRYGTSESDLETLTEQLPKYSVLRFTKHVPFALVRGNLEETFGELNRYDIHFVSLNYAAHLAFRNHHYESFNGEMFVENLRSGVRTFITNAEEDIIIYAKAIPLCLKKFTGYGISDVDIEDESFTVRFTDGSNASVTFPFYPEAPHSVPVILPEKFLSDVKNWLGN
ncbi:hypothetical protein J5834_07630 [bacterium]|nr:hypothetical protein [bacterium]